MAKRLLFVCNLNSVRSPMAAALAAALPGRDIEAVSAGLEPGEADPFAASVLAEEGLDISTHVPASFDADLLTAASRIICLTEEAHEHVLLLLKRKKLKKPPVEYWPTLDPFACGHRENREQRLAAYRTLRDQLRGMIAERL